MSPTRYVKSGGAFVELGGGAANPTAPLGFLDNASGTGTVVNRSYFGAFRVYDTATIDQVSIFVTVAGNNVDLGIFTGTSSLPVTKLVSTGSVAVSGTGVRTYALTSTELTPGIYWMAFACNGSTFQGGRITNVNTYDATTGLVLPKRFQASTFPLPATVGSTSVEVTTWTQWVDTA